MATSGDETESPAAAGNVVLKTGYLHKRGGSYRSWKKRYFVLSNVDLKYFKREGASTPKNVIDLRQGRGVRNQDICNLEWPNDAKPGLSFGLATEKRTYYLYGNDKAIVRDWMSMLQQCINKIGKPSDDYRNDPEGKPESAISKAVRGGVKLAARVTKFVTGESGIVDEDTASAIEGAADSAQNQTDPDRDSTVSDRLKMPCEDAAGIVGDSVDNETVGTTTSVAQEQLETDKDVSLQQRVPMAMATTAEGTSEMGDIEIAAGILTSTDVAGDQAEDSEEMNTKQRLILVSGSVVGGASEMVDNEILSSTMEVTGGGITDQTEANEDVSLGRATMAVGSVAGGAKGLDTMTYNSESKDTCSAIESTPEKAQEKNENENGSPR